MSTVGEKIKEYRAIAGLTQQQLADITGLSKTTIQGYEAEKFEPKASSLYKIALALHVTPDMIDPSISWDSNYPLTPKIFPNTEEMYAKIKEIQTNLASMGITSDPFLRSIAEIGHTINNEGKQRILNYAEDIADNPKYKA